jgi:hypothetical protein
MAQSLIEYVNMACTLADEMALVGKKIDGEGLITGLNYEYNSVVSALVTRPDVITIGGGGGYSQLLSYEQRVEWQNGESYQPSANAASQGRGECEDAWVLMVVIVLAGVGASSRALTIQYQQLL